ncbi:MAG: hypothetical protein KDE31_38050, partial [Caldilineaceae bacterium]|nr:hypothetical protein [Caldilineaceae bacterium]
MSNDLTFCDFAAIDPVHIDAVATLWNDACPNELRISSRFVRHNVTPVTGGIQAGKLALVGGEIAGVILVSSLRDNRLVNPHATGWIDAI